MEVPNINPVLEKICSAEAVSKYFSAEDIKSLAGEMTDTIVGVLGDRKFEVVFTADTKMFATLGTRQIHLGLGMIKAMISTWEKKILGGLAAGKGEIDVKSLKEKVVSSLIADAAHEAGHLVIDRRPSELWISQEEWGMVGISSLANALLDCRNDQRIMVHHPDLKENMTDCVDFNFGPDGRQDWISGDREILLKTGFSPLFTQFESEAMRIWAFGEIHPLTNPRVKNLLEVHREQILFIAKDKACIPARNPHELEVKAKARKAYGEISKINAGDYQKVLVSRDRENQAIHQAVSAVGLFWSGYAGIPQKLKDLLEQKLSSMDEELNYELQYHIAFQQMDKADYEKNNISPETIADAQAEKVKEVLEGAPGFKEGLSDEPDSQPTEGEGTATAKQPETYFDLLGPAVKVEGISDPLRDFLKKLFEEMSKEMQEEINQNLLNQILQMLLGDPDKALKVIEDAINEKLRPHTVPSTMPSHKESEDNPPPMPQKDEKPNPKPFSQNSLPVEDLIKLAPRELEETEAWLDENLDMQERIFAWREAIHSVIKGAKKKTDRPQDTLYVPELVMDEIRQEMGLEQSGKIFLNTKVEKREKINLSVLWRTVAMPVSEALKLILFLCRIHSDAEIRQHLDLEILFSQDIPDVKKTSGKTPVPVVVSFGDDPVADYEKIVDNLMVLNKSAKQGGNFPIVQDATALKTQRDRLLKHNPSAKRKFAIDLWDEMAIELGAKNAMEAVLKEIRLTQSALDGKAFCFVLKTAGASKIATPARTYGENNFLIEKSTERLIRYLDVVVRTMICFPDTYSQRIKEQIERELDIHIE